MKLRTGTEVPESVLGATVMALRKVITENGVAFYEAVMLARNPGHMLFPGTPEYLQRNGLIDNNGKMHDIIRDIILASVEGDDLDMTLVSPV